MKEEGISFRAHVLVGKFGFFCSFNVSFLYVVSSLISFSGGAPYLWLRGSCFSFLRRVFPLFMEIFKQ